MKNNNVSELNLALFRQAMNDTRPTVEGVPEIYVIMKNYVKNIPYPEEDRVSQTSGYPKDYLIEHLDSILNDINGR